MSNSETSNQRDDSEKSGWEARRVRISEIEIGPSDPFEDFVTTVRDMMADAGNEVGGRPCVMKVTVEVKTGELKRPGGGENDGE